MKKILVPVDFSARTDNAIDFALNILKVNGGSMEILHSFYEQLQFSDGGYSTGFESSIMITDEIIQDFYDQKKKNLEELKGQVEAKVALEGLTTVIIETFLYVGTPEQQIVDHIQKSPPDLIVMGSDGLGKHGFLSGSVTQKVMDHASVPVIAVPENSISRYPKNIMYMTSFDEKDAVGIGTVFSVFNREEIELHCLHLNIDDRADDCELQMDRLISKQVIGSFIDKIKTDILDCSHPHDVIEAYIKLKKIDLIAFIPHRRRSWQYLFTQDLTKKDLFQAKVPIMGIH